MRVWGLLAIVLALLACQEDEIVSDERFEINAVEEEKRTYCDDDDIVEKELDLAGEIKVFDTNGAIQHTGKVSAFKLTAELNCTDNNPASIALTPVSDAGQSVEVTYTYKDGTNTEVTKTVSLSLAESEASLSKDPPIVHADHRLHTWFGYDDTKNVRVVLQKQEELDDTLAEDFHVEAYVLHDVTFSDSTDGKVSLHLSEKKE